MTTATHRSSWTAAGVRVLMVVLLASGVGVADAWAKEGAARTRSKAAVKAGNSSSSRTVTRSTSSASGTARNTRQTAPRSSRSSFGRGHRGHRGHHHGGYYRYYPSSYFNFLVGYGYWGFYPSYYWRYWAPYYYPPVYYGHGRPYYRSADLGALDLNVKPKKAEVYLDGEYIGLVKQFDGYPGYLWLEKGSHEISFYHQGFRTLTREFRVYPGSVVDVRLRLEPGEAVLPEKPAQPPKRKAERSPRLDRERSYDPDEDREKYRRPWRRVEPEDEAEERDLRGEPGRLRLSITPGDATVYLDGRLLGSGNELSRLRAGLIVEPGEHLLEVVRPGFDAKQLEVRVEEGEELELAVQLIRSPESA